MPRLLERLALEPRAWEVTSAGSEVLLGKLALARWRDWPPAERDAVAAFVDALWSDALDRFPGERDVDALLTGLGRAVEDVSHLLASWRARAAVEAPAARHLAAFALANAGARGRLPNAFWEEAPAAMNQVLSWLAEPRTEEALERAFFAFSAEPFASDLSLAFEVLRSLRPG